MVKKYISIFAAIVILLTGLISASAETVPALEANISEINQNGNIILSIGAKSMGELGYEPADIVLVKIGNAEMEMPIGTNYTDVDSGKPICRFKFTNDADDVILTINNGNLATVMGIAEYHATDAEPGYEWVFADGFDSSVPVTISMVQKQGYADEYARHQLGRTRSNNHADYANLSDDEYANFRAVETSGMGKGTLFRSSSPVNPELNRNNEADEALLRSLIKTVMNMADTEEAMTNFPDYRLTSYSACNIISLNMNLDFFSEDFQQKLVEGFRFIASHDGPYLIHCIEGKDRTGFAIAILECLMGASADEVVQDYMLTYYNFYGIEPGTPQYEQIAASNIETSLSRIFGIQSIHEENTDLKACAEAWLKSIGMSANELSMLKEKLHEDYGGLN